MGVSGVKTFDGVYTSSINQTLGFQCAVTYNTEVTVVQSGREVCVCVCVITMSMVVMCVKQTVLGVISLVKYCPINSQSSLSRY